MAELQARVLGDEEKHAIPFTIHNLPRTTVKHCHSMEGAAKVVKSDLSVLAVPLSKTETGFDFVQSSVAAWQVRGLDGSTHPYSTCCIFQLGDCGNPPE